MHVQGTTGRMATAVRERTAGGGKVHRLVRSLPMPAPLGKSRDNPPVRVAMHRGATGLEVLRAEVVLVVRHAVVRAPGSAKTSTRAYKKRVLL